MYRRIILAGEKKEPVISAYLLGGTCVLSVFQFAKNSIFQPNYTNSLKLRGDKGPIEPSEKLQNVFNEVIKDVGEHIPDNTKVTPILVPGRHFFHNGTFQTHNGGCVGMPEFYEFNTKEDLDKRLALTNPDYVNGGSEMDNVKLESFLLSDKAKKYGIAHEIIYIDTYKMYIDCALPQFIAYIMCLSTESLSSTIVSRYSPFLVGGYYFGFVMFGMTVWAYAQKHLTNFFEFQVESEIVKLGEDYIKGGQEYYTKYIERESSNIDVTIKQKSSIFYKIGNIFSNFFDISNDQLKLKLLERKSYYDSLVDKNESLG